jgi:hypothetical protein
LLIGGDGGGDDGGDDWWARQWAHTTCCSVSGNARKWIADVLPSRVVRSISSLADTAITLCDANLRYTVSSTCPVLCVVEIEYHLDLSLCVCVCVCVGVGVGVFWSSMHTQLVQCCRSSIAIVDLEHERHNNIAATGDQRCVRFDLVHSLRIASLLDAKHLLDLRSVPRST